MTHDDIYEISRRIGWDTKKTKSLFKIQGYYEDEGKTINMVWDSEYLPLTAHNAQVMDWYNAREPGVMALHNLLTQARLAGYTVKHWPPFEQ